MPATTRGTADAGARSTEMDLAEPMGLQPIALASLDQRAIVLEARTNAAAAFHAPASISKMPQKPNPRAAILVDSRTARGSSSRNEGTAKARVTTAAATNGTIRSPKSRSAQYRGERCWP